MVFNVFEHLMELDKDGTLVPRLATSWRWLDDRTLEVKLRQGVKFHIFRARWALRLGPRAALASRGIVRPWWSHGALQATFSTELVRRRKLYPLSFVHYLTDAMELRHTADYSDIQIPPKRAIRLVEAAMQFVNRVKEVIGNA